MQAQRDLSTAAGSEPVAPFHAVVHTARLVLSNRLECKLLQALGFCAFLLNRTEF